MISSRVSYSLSSSIRNGYLVSNCQLSPIVGLTVGRSTEIELGLSRYPPTMIPGPSGVRKILSLDWHGVSGYTALHSQ